MNLIIDLSDVLLFFQTHWTVSGIQRVSLRVAQLLIAQHGHECQIQIMAIDQQGRAIIGDISCLDSTDVERDAFLRAFSLPTDPIRRFVRQLRLTTRRGNPVAGTKANFSTGRLPGETDFNGALILVTGGIRPNPRYWEVIEGLRLSGAARVITTVYDLIPLIRSELVPDDQPGVFYDGIHGASRSTDHFISISNTTARHLSSFLNIYRYPEKPIAVVPLAHEFMLKAEPSDSVASDRPSPLRLDIAERGGVWHGEALGIRRDVKSCRLHPYVLVVGTIEPRKNLVRLCHVWAQLLRELGPDATPHLVFAGKKAYGREEFEEFLRATGYLAGHIRVLDAPSDKDLAFLYRNCLYTVFPSLAEGWGLPVGESLWHGKLCVASRAWSIPEVGGDLCDYFDPQSSSEMLDRLRFWISNPTALEKRETLINAAELRTWAQVAEDLWPVLSYQQMSISQLSPSIHD